MLFHPVTSLRWLKLGEGHRSFPRLCLSHGLALGVLAWGCCLFSLLSLMDGPEAGWRVWMAEIGLGLGLGVLLWGYGAVLCPLAALVKALPQLEATPPIGPAPIAPPPPAPPNLAPAAPNPTSAAPRTAIRARRRAESAQGPRTSETPRQPYQR